MHRRLGFDCVWESRSAASPPARFGYARSRDLLSWQDLAARALGRQVEPMEGTGLWPDHAWDRRCGLRAASGERLHG